MVKNKKSIIIVIIIILLLLINVILLNKLNKIKKEKSQNIEQEEGTHISFYSYNNDENTDVIKVVSDRNDFFTMESCVNKYIQYLTQKDKESIYKLLDETYIKEYNIKQENVLEFVEDLNGYFRFKAKKMNFENIEEGVYKYYITGELIEERVIDDINQEEEQEEGDTEEIIVNDKMQIIVIADINNLTFSIIPFKDGGATNE